MLLRALISILFLTPGLSFAKNCRYQDCSETCNIEQLDQNGKTLAEVLRLDVSTYTDETDGSKHKMIYSDVIKLNQVGINIPADQSIQFDAGTDTVFLPKQDLGIFDSCKVWRYDDKKHSNSDPRMLSQEYDAIAAGTYQHVYLPMLGREDVFGQHPMEGMYFFNRTLSDNSREGFAHFAFTPNGDENRALSVICQTKGRFIPLVDEIKASQLPSFLRRSINASCEPPAAITNSSSDDTQTHYPSGRER